MTEQFTTRTAFFAEPLARLHAEFFADRFRAGFDWLADQLRSTASRPVLFDLGCGAGAWMTHVSNMKIKAYGIDKSHYFVNICRDAGLDVRPDCAASAPLPEAVSAVTALGEVLAYHPSALAPAARRIARALPPGGLLLFDLPGPDLAEGDIDRAGPGWRLTLQTRVEGNRLLRRIFLETGAGTSQETHHLRLFAPEEALGILRGFGFEAEILTGYGPAELPPGHFALRARKP